MKPNKMDAVIVKAFQSGLLEFKGDDLVATKAGLEEMEAIAKVIIEILAVKCPVMIRDLEQVGKEMGQVFRKDFSILETYLYSQNLVYGSDARCLAILLDDKENNYKVIHQTVELFNSKYKAMYPETESETGNKPVTTDSKVTSIFGKRGQKFDA